MQSAIFGLIGVALGAVLAIFRDLWNQRRKNKKDAEYLAIVVSCALHRFVADCASVVADDGLCQGQPDEHGCLTPQVNLANFETELLSVEWKSLPGKLMYEVLGLPYKVELAKHKIIAVSEFSSPPGYEEAFEERQYQYAVLGLGALNLARQLLDYVTLPVRQHDDWDLAEFMVEHRTKIEQKRIERANRVSPV